MPSCTARLMSPTLRLRISTMRGVSYSKRKLWKAPYNAMAAAAKGRRPGRSRPGPGRGCRSPTAPRAARRALPQPPGPQQIARGQRRQRHRQPRTFHGCFHRIAECIRLENTSEIIEANPSPSTTLSNRPDHWVLRQSLLKQFHAW